jgi:hypothetical protein
MEQNRLNMKATLEELGAGQRCGVFIDDTGSPGTQPTQSGPHAERATWVAVVIPPSQMPEVLDQMPRAVDGLNELVGASEFHCVDIFQGEKQFENVDLQKRLSILAFLARIFSLYGFPIFVQTFDPINLSGVHEHLQGLRNLRLGPFDFSKPKDAALFFLLVRIREYLLKERQSPDHLASAFIDERFKGSDRALVLPPWKDVFADGLLHSNSSALVLPLQLADFAAYALNRQQILLGRSKLSPLDQTLLGIFATASLQFQNIPTVKIKLSEDGSWNFEQ